MRIAFDVSYIQKMQTGIGRLAELIIKALLNAEQKNEYVLHGWSFGLNRAALRRLADSRTRVSIARIPGDIKRFYWNRLRFPNIETIVGEVDIFHSNDPSLPATKRAKTICTIHDLAYKKFPELLESRVSAWDAFVQRSARTADAIITPSEHSRHDIMEMFGIAEERIHVVRIPASASFSYQKNEAQDIFVKEKYDLTHPYMLFVGTFEPRKNIPALVKAFEVFKQEWKAPTDLVLVGKKGWLYEKTFAAIAASPCKTSIRYFHYVPEEELASLYRQALCFVLPSLYEGYGSPILEAMASGIPIITSNNSSLRELADGVALLVDPTNPADMSEAMLMLAKDEVRRVEMRQRGLHVIQQYTPAATAKAVLDVYERVFYS